MYNWSSHTLPRIYLRSQMWNRLMPETATYVHS